LAEVMLFSLARDVFDGRREKRFPVPGARGGGKNPKKSPREPAVGGKKLREQLTKIKRCGKKKGEPARLAPGGGGTTATSAQGKKVPLSVEDKREMASFFPFHKKKRECLPYSRQKVGVFLSSSTTREKGEKEATGTASKKRRVPINLVEKKEKQRPRIELTQKKERGKVPLIYTGKKIYLGGQKKV